MPNLFIIFGDMPDLTPELSVIVPCRGHARELRGLLAALEQQTLAADRWELVVADDGSRIPLVLPAHALPHVRVLHLEPAGPAAARNAAMREARGRLFVFLNADAVPAPDALARHIEAHPIGSSARSVMGRFDFLPRHHTPFLALADAVGSLFPYDLVPRHEPAPFRYFWSGNLSVDAAAMRAVGGFDERFRGALFEDVELGFRLEQSGVPLWFAPEITAGHDHAIELPAWLTRAEAFGHEWVLFARAHGAAAFPVLTGVGEPDAALGRELLAAVLDQHALHAARLAALETLLIGAETDLGVGVDPVVVDARVVAAGRALLDAINTFQRMSGVLAAIHGHTPADLARHRAALRASPLARDLRDLVAVLALSPELAAAAVGAPSERGFPYAALSDALPPGPALRIRADGPLALLHL